MNDFLDLSKFTIKEEIGHGAFGQVFKAQEQDTENIFAVKISFTELNNYDATFIIDLKREVNILSQLNHPSVLKFIGYGPFDFNHKNYPVIMTEYSPNGSLSDIIELDRGLKAPKSWTDTKKLINIYGVASAMVYLHSHNIIHRDLKPANILEDDNLFPKIADFGLSKSYHSKIDQTIAKSGIGIKGTPIYIAPEIWNNGEYTKAGDVYAFSIIVYELLTLDEPFKNINFYTLFSKVIINNERPKFNYPIPACYINLIERCWSNDPNKRPTFQEIVTELRTNNEFIIDSIDKKEFFNYVDSIDYIGNSFNLSKKMKIMISKEKKSQNFVDKISKQPEKISEEKTDESSEINIITVEAFNSYPMKKQQEIINNMIANKEQNENKEILNNINELLKYLLRNDIKPNNQYFSIPTNDIETSIDEILQETSKISLSYQMIEKKLGKMLLMNAHH